MGGRKGEGGRVAAAPFKYSFAVRFCADPSGSASAVQAKPRAEVSECNVPWPDALFRHSPSWERSHLRWSLCRLKLAVMKLTGKTARARETDTERRRLDLQKQR